MKPELIRRLGTSKPVDDRTAWKVIEEVYADEIAVAEKNIMIAQDSHCEYCGLAHATASTPDCHFYVKPERKMDI